MRGRTYSVHVRLWAAPRCVGLLISWDPLYILRHVRAKVHGDHGKLLDQRLQLPRSDRQRRRVLCVVRLFHQLSHSLATDVIHKPLDYFAHRVAVRRRTAFEAVNRDHASSWSCWCCWCWCCCRLLRNAPQLLPVLEWRPEERLRRA